jgi:outer membrane protein TolC
MGCCAVSLLCASPLARADEAPAPLPSPTRALTLPEALDYAHSHQPAIRAAVARVSARLAQAKVPTAQWLPTVSATAQLFATTSNNTTATYVQPDVMDIPRIGASASTTRGGWSPYASTLVGAGIQQEAFDFGRIAAERSAADAQVDVEKHGADAVRLDADFAVEEAYFSAFAAHGIVRVADEAYQRSLVHRDFARHGVDAGMRPPIELTRAEADLARFDVGRVRARGALAVAETVLAAAIGAPEQTVDVAGEAPQPRDMPALSQALEMARQRDPVLAAALARLAATERETRAIGAGLRPDVSLTATLTGRAGGAPPSSGGVPPGNGWLPDVPNWDLGIVFAWPLFEGTIAARRDASHVEEEVRREEIDVAQEQQVEAVRQAYAQVEVARTALLALQHSVAAARANWEQADARFRGGLGTAVELADAEAVRTDAEVQLALGQFEVARARAAFGRTIAEGL